MDHLPHTWARVVHPQDQEVWEARGICYRPELGDKAGAQQWCVHHTAHAPSYIPCPSFSLPCLSQTAFSKSYFLHLSSCLFPCYQGPKLFLYLALSFWNSPPRRFETLHIPIRNPALLSLLYPSPFTPSHPLAYPTSSLVSPEIFSIIPGPSYSILPCAPWVHPRHT